MAKKYRSISTKKSTSSKNSGKGIDKQKNRRNILNNFKEWVLKPLREYILNDPDKNHYIAFILMSVALDNLSNIRYLGEMPDERNRGNSKKRFVTFIENYFPEDYQKYTSDLYKSYRCKLVHEFQLYKFDIQQSLKSERYHLQPHPRSNDICLNSNILYADIKKAYKKLEGELLADRKNNAAKRSFDLANFKKWGHNDIL